MDMKTSKLMVGIATALSLSVIAGCGGGDGGSTDTRNLTYRNVALASDGSGIGTSADLENAKKVIDGVFDKSSSYWTSNTTEGKDEVIVIMNRGKSIDKIVLYANDVDFITSTNKTMSIAQFAEGPWYDIALKPTPDKSDDQECTLKLDVVTGKSITCTFSPAIQFRYLRLHINSRVPSSQFIYEIQAWGKDA